MTLVVPDASVILKWVLSGNEPEQEKALLLLNQWLEGQVHILLPPLWLFEVANVLGIKCPDLADEILQDLLAYEFKEIKMDDRLCHTALVIMKMCKTSFYDASYHALAIQENGLFVTADEAYFRKVKQQGAIHLLSKWE